MDGFLNLNKPAGFTSHDCVAKVRKLLKLKRIGHAGTLDPAAIGVLPLAIGRATRLLQYLRSDKAYHATIRFGLRTATDDLDGEILAQQAVPDLELSRIQAELPLFEGKINQIPPNYSAIQVQGKRLYELARSGNSIDVPARSVEIYRIDLLDWRSSDFPELDLAIACGSGTYIRSIARDLGDVLGTGATLAKLIRTESSGFSLSDSVTIDDLNSQIPLIQSEAALMHLPEIRLDDPIAHRWRQGQKIAVESELDLGMAIRVKDEHDRFLGIAHLRVDRVLVPQMVYEPVV